MSLLAKDQILAANDLQSEEVEVPEWGGSVRVTMMSGVERDAFEESITDIGKDGKVKTTMKNFRAKLCAACIVDPDGNRMFSDAEVESLGKKSAKAINRVFETAQRLNGIGAKATEEITQD